MSLRDPEFRESLEGFFATSRLESEPKLPHHLVSGVGKRRFITSSPTPTAHARCSHAVGVRPLLRELAADRDPSLGAPAGGMNAATRAIVRYCVRQGHKPFAIHNGFVGLLDDNVHQLSWLGVDNWTTRGGSELGTNRKLPDIDLGAVAANFQQYNFHALIMIGAFEAFSSLLILEQGRKHYAAFNIPMALMFLALSSSADAYNATQRLYGVFEAETLTETKVQDSEMKHAVEIVDAEFVWDGPPPEEAKKSKKAKKAEKKSRPATPTEPQSQESTFKLKNVNLTIPQGQLVAIVGPVGSGKSSLLESMIGEMRRTAGTVRFNGTVAYCPQSAWIQNATVRENITFGQPFDEERYWKAVHDACLEADLELLPNGDMTEVGERVSTATGIRVIGGCVDHAHRVSRCRAGRSSASTSAVPSTSEPTSRSSTTPSPPSTPMSASTSSRTSSSGPRRTRRASW